MYISLLVILSGIFRGIEGTICQDTGTKDGIQVAAFCQNSNAAGNSLILDGYAAYKTETEKTCSCSALVNIPNSGSATVAFSSYYALQPNYQGCGSSIVIKDPDETRIHACFVGGAISVIDKETISFDLKKEFSPEDTRYCMRMIISDPSSNLTVTCSSGTDPVPPITSSTSIPSVTTITSSSAPISKHSLETSSVSTQEQSTEQQFSSTISSSSTRVDITTQELATQKSPEISTSPSLTMAVVTTRSSTLTTGSNLFTTSSQPEKTTKTIHVISTDSDVISSTEKLTTKTSTEIEVPSSKSTKQITTKPKTTMQKLTTQKTGLISTTGALPKASSTSFITTEVKIERSSQAIQSSSQSSSPLVLTTGRTTDSPPDTRESKDEEVPVEVIAPVASVGGLLIICLIICIVVGVRRNNCGCTDEQLATNSLVDKVSVDIKIREKDTYVNPLYDDISLTGRSERSDKDSMMHEIPSDDDDDDFRLPSSTEIDGELWTHL